MKRMNAMVIGVLLVAAIFVTPASAHIGQQWTGTWSASQVAAVPDLFGVPNWSGGFDNQSLRQVVRISRGGLAVRIRVSNVYGAAPLQLTGASIGKAADGASIRQGALRRLTFGKSAAVVVPAGQERASDALLLPVAALERLTVTLYFAGPTGPASFHPMASATSYRAEGDHRFDRGGDAFHETTRSWYYLSGVDVAGLTWYRGAVVAFGDSITDGAFTTVDANKRYPDDLADRLVASGKARGVLNAGIGGNRLLGDAAGLGERGVARFQRDALDRPAVRTVIVLEGINDIGIGELLGTPVTAQQLIDGYRILIRAARAKGVRIVGATITPTKGTPFAGFYTERGEAVRDAVNHWIRTSGEYDAFVDFDRALADPADPDRMRPEYNSGDGVHPNDTGAQAMADAIDLRAL